jgi:DNA-binding MarR family transcriptional regulator
MLGMGSMRRDLAATAWAAVLRTHAAVVPVLDNAVRRAVGLPLSWYDVLLELAAAPGRQLRMSELGERVVLSRTRVSRIVDELVVAGLVSRISNPDDGRSSYAALTDAGLARYRAAAPHYLKAIEEEFASALTDTQLRQVANALSLVAAHSAGPLRGS